jgi:hypothetical protein
VVRDAVEDVQQASKDDPLASLEVIAGAALTAVGVPLGPKLIASGAGRIVDGAVSADSPPGSAPVSPGIGPPQPAPGSVLPLTASATSDVAGPSSLFVRHWKAIAGGIATAGAVAVVAWLSQGENSSS